MNPENTGGGGTNGRWSNAFLDEMQQTGDLSGDEAMSELFSRHGIEAVNSLWSDLIKNDEMPPTSLPKEIQAYFEESAIFPEWADPKLIAQGETFFGGRGIFCLVSLLTASLPECYVLRNEADVLGTTRDLENHTYRRVFETTQLIVDVMKEGGLGRSGDGVKAAQKVRLMHAAIRHLILKTPRKQPSTEPPKSFADVASRMPRWDVARCGLPINQEQMAYTLLTFSYVILRAFDGMKIPLTRDERTAYLHCWNVVGHILGVRRELLAFTFEDAGILFSKIKERRMGTSEAGEALANALVKCGREIIAHETDGMVPRWICRKLPAVIMHMLLGKQTVAVLKIQRLTFWEWNLLNLLRLSAVIFQLGYQKMITLLGKKFGQSILVHLTKMPRGGNRRLFQIPDKLRSDWNIKQLRAQP